MGKLNDFFHKLKSIALKDGDDTITYSIIFHLESNEKSLQIFKTLKQYQCLPKLTQCLLKENCFLKLDPNFRLLDLILNAKINDQKKFFPIHHSYRF